MSSTKRDRKKQFKINNNCAAETCLLGPFISETKLFTLGRTRVFNKGSF